MPNIEVKARYTDLTRGHVVAKEIHAKYVGHDHQIDTYFKTPMGRFKLRETSLSGAYLIPYLRLDQQAPKKSSYVLIPVTDVAHTKQLFTFLLGVVAVVEKHRDIYLYDNIRIHLDDVKNLGTFFELEAVYSDDSAENIQNEHQKIKTLMSTFGIKPEALIPGSYLDALISL